MKNDGKLCRAKFFNILNFKYFYVIKRFSKYVLTYVRAHTAYSYFYLPSIFINHRNDNKEKVNRTWNIVLTIVSAVREKRNVRLLENSELYPHHTQNKK